MSVSQDATARARDSLGTVQEASSPPLLRGWLHLICFFLSLPAGALVVVSAGSPRARVGALIYAVGLCALFGVSGAYHRFRWSPRSRARMKRLDHATIFVMIAGSYTPLCLVALDEAAGGWVLAGVWVGASVGLSLAAVGVAERRIIGLVCYMGFGWAAVIALPQLARGLSSVELALVVIGGLLYTLGGVVLATGRPDPFPRVFGYHEVWHVMVVVAAACHFCAILSVVSTTS